MPAEEDGKPKSAFFRFYDGLFAIIDTPVTAFREKFVEPAQNRNKTYYYHRRYRRVPTIDECEIGDPVCYFEANEQFRRDRRVDEEILTILRQRQLECQHYHGHDADKYCEKVRSDYLKAEENWFGKYGDMGARLCVMSAYMKQKHRMIWERRHGPIGNGRSDSVKH